MESVRLQIGKHDKVSYPTVCVLYNFINHVHDAYQ